MTHPDRKTSSLATASRWLAAFVLAWLPSTSAGATDSTPLTFQLESEHFDLLIQDHDPRPLIFRLERLHAELSRYFGANTRERMRIRTWAEREDAIHYMDGLSDADRAHWEGGGLYFPEHRTAVVHDRIAHRDLLHRVLLHEAVHFFQYEALVDGPQWLTEGLAEVFER